MKKVLFTVLAGVLAGMTFVPALAEDDADKTFEFNGMVRARYEYLNNYLDLTDNQDSGDIFDDAFSITPYRVMVGMTGNFAKDVSAHVDLQYTGHFGDELHPSKDNPHYLPYDPFTPIEQGDAAYQYATQGMQIYQGYIEMGKIGGSDFAVRIGRQEHTYGTELFLGDNDFYSGLSFDGARGMWKHGSSDLNFFYYKIAEDNCSSFACFGIAGSRDSNLFGATYDWTFATMGTVGGYALIGQDLGSDGPVGTVNSKVNTIGARWNRGMMTEDKLNMFDWNIEYAVQNGDIGGPQETPLDPVSSVDLGGWIGEGWFGFNFKAGDSHGRAHIGTLMTSGDKTSSTKNEGFVPLYGDFHANNRFGDLDYAERYGVSNFTDYNVGYDHWFGEDHHVMFAYHMLSLTEDNGAVTDKFGDEIDLKYGYQYSKNLSFEVSIGQFSADDKQFGPTDAVQRAYAQAKLNW